MLAKFATGTKFIAAPAAWDRYRTLAVLAGEAVPDVDVHQDACPDSVLQDLRVYVRGTAELVALIAGPTFAATIPFSQVAKLADRSRISQTTEAMGTMHVEASDTMTPEMESMMHTFHAVMTCASAIDKPGSNRGGLGLTSAEAMAAQVPEPVKLFLSVLHDRCLPVDSIDALGDEATAANRKQAARQRQWTTAIGADIVFICSKGAYVPDKHVNAANDLHLK